jgi:methyl-accepting chemotaxis protein
MDALNQFLATLSLRNKVRLLLVTAILGMIAIGGTGIYGEYYLSHAADDLGKRQMPSSHAQGKMDMMHDGIRAVVFRSLLVAEHPAVSQGQDILSEAKEFAHLFNEQRLMLDSLVTNPEIREHLEKVKPDIVAYGQMGEQMVAMATQGKAKEAFAQLPEFQALFEKLEESLGSLGDMIQNSAASHADEVSADGNRLFWVSVITFFVIGGVVTALALYLIQFIVLPLNNLVGVLNQLGRGDLKVRADLSGGQELESIAASLNHALENLQQALLATLKGAEGLSQNAKQLENGSQAVVENTLATAQQADLVNSASQQVNQNLNTVASAAEEMQASIREIAEQTNRASQVANSAHQQSEGTVHLIEKLDTSSQQIGQIVSLITSIAEQTNLLALNATIEAARAGEMGKGFAVVAGEVKELAHQTAKATEEIASKVEAIRTDSGAVATSIKSIAAIIGDISQTQAGVATAIEQQTATTAEISRTLNEAARGGGEIAEGIGIVAEKANHSSSNLQMTREGIKSISTLAAELRACVTQFQV